MLAGSRVSPESSIVAPLLSRCWFDLVCSQASVRWRAPLPSQWSHLVLPNGSLQPPSELKASYGALMQYSGVRSPNTLKRAIDELEDVGWLKRIATKRSGVIRDAGSYLLTPLSDSFVEAAGRCHQALQVTIDRERTAAGEKRTARESVLLTKSTRKGRSQ